jgi:uncharacterized protein YdiU (UPF0061 family)
LIDGNARDQFLDPSKFDDWAEAWTARLGRETRSEDDRTLAMKAVNPAVIPRNHRIEEAIEAAVAGDFALFERLNTVLAAPFEDQNDNGDLKAPPADSEIVHQTFCGT